MTQQLPWRLLVAGAVLASASSVLAQTPAAPPSNQFPFATVNAGGSNRMLQRFEDPEQRKELRALRRKGTAAQQVLMEQVVPLDAATRERFIDLVTDLEMERDERHLRGMRPARAASTFGSPEEMDQALERERFANDSETVRMAQEQTRYLAPLRNLLGEERFQLYVDYRASVFQRMQAARLDSQLSAGDKLSVEQRERLITLLADEYRRRLDRQQQQQQRASAERFYYPQPNVQLPDMSTQVLLSAEQTFVEAQQANESLLARLPGVLSERQINVFVATEANTNDEAARVRSMRKRAGRDPQVAFTLPDASVQVQHVPVTEQLQLQLHIKVDDAPPVDTTVDVADDGSATVELGGVIIEVRAALFENDWQEVATRFYERTGRGRRELTSLRIPPGQFAGPKPLQLNAVLAGSRGYAVVANLSVRRRAP